MFDLTTTIILNNVRSENFTRPRNMFEGVAGMQAIIFG